MMRYLLMLIALCLPLLALAWCSAPSWRLEAICREKAGITVLDSDRWATFITKVKRRDLADQRAMLDARSSGAVVGPADTEEFIRPFGYVEGYEYIPDRGHSHYSGEPQPSREPQAHNVTVMIENEKVAILHDFEAKLPSFEYSRTMDCSSDFPEVFEIHRTAVLK